MQKLWFRNKWYGWGWYPATWQGWAVIGIYVILITAFSLTINNDSPTREVVFTFILPVTLLTIAIIRICYKTGEKPHWQWGPPKKDENKK